MSQRHEEESWVEFFDWLALHKDSWNHIVFSLKVSYCHLVTMRISEDIVSVKSLALVRNHISVDLRLISSISSGLNDHCDKLRHLISEGMSNCVFLLLFGYLLDVVW